MWLTVCTAVVGYIPDGSFKRWLTYKVSIMCFAVLSSALSSVITYHNPENRPVRGICVANHTSPIDVLVLMCDNCYSLVRFLVRRLWIVLRLLLAYSDFLLCLRLFFFTNILRMHVSHFIDYLFILFYFIFSRNNTFLDDYRFNGVFVIDFCCNEN